MLPLLGGRKKECLENDFQVENRKMRKCSSDGLDTFSK